MDLLLCKKFTQGRHSANTCLRVNVEVAQRNRAPAAVVTVHVQRAEHMGLLQHHSSWRGTGLGVFQRPSLAAMARH